MEIKLIEQYLGNPVGFVLNPGKAVSELLIKRKIAVKVTQKKKKRCADGN